MRGRAARRRREALLGAYKVLLKYCVTVGWLEQSPAEQLTARAVAGPAPASRSRVLSDDELRVVLTTGSAPGPVLRFLLATGLRIGEAYNGHRESQHWIIPAGSAKNGREHRVWLSPLALAQLEQRPWASRAVVQAWVTAHSGGWTAHDLRRTFATRINGMGAAPHVVEKLLNHTLPGLMATYNRAEYLPERQQALEAWSQWLTGLVGKPHANSGEVFPATVIPLRQAAVAA